MPNTLLISGSYTPYARLSIGASGRKISLTGFSATFRKNKVISNGAWRFAESVNSVAQHRGAYFQDVPSIDLKPIFSRTFLTLSVRKETAPLKFPFTIRTPISAGSLRNVSLVAFPFP